MDPTTPVPARNTGAVAPGATGGERTIYVCDNCGDPFGVPRVIYRAEYAGGKAWLMADVSPCCRAEFAAEPRP